MKITAETQLCAVIGHPVAHSLSPAMHNAAFEALDLNYVYLAFDVEDVSACLTGVRALPGFRGLSVTIPHKPAVMAYLDEISPMARMVGCVNTITRKDGRLSGMITDGTGALRAFSGHGVDLQGKRIAFLGAGGAVRAVAYAMALECAPAGVTILGRDVSKARVLAEDLRRDGGRSIREGSLTEDLEEILSTHEVIVQGTPMGMYGHQEGLSCVPVAYLRKEHVVFDMVYRPRYTKLLEDAVACGCVTIPGLDMLLYQAAIQFEEWTGVAAPLAVMRAALEKALAEDGHN